MLRIKVIIRLGENSPELFNYIYLRTYLWGNFHYSKKLVVHK